MYERFTDRARKVMQLANHEALRFNHEYIGTEHILLGLIAEGAGVAAHVLTNLEIDLRKIRREVEKIIQSGPDMVISGRLPQTPRAKKVIEYAMEEARNLNHNYVGTEHLLLGTLRETEGVGAQVLLNLGLQLQGVRKEILTLLGHTDVKAAPARRMVETEAFVLKPLNRPTEYTDRARKVMQFASEEAYNFGHTYIGSEHILLGIYRAGTSLAVESLKSGGLTHANLRGEIENLLRVVGPASASHFQLNIYARETLSLAAISAASLSSKQIDSDHFVLAMLKQKSGIVDQVLINFGIERLELPKQIRSRLESEDQSQSGEE